MGDQDLPFEKLVAYVSGDLDRAESEGVERRLARSGRVANEVARLREVIEALRTDDAETPRSEIVERVVRAFSRETTSAAQRIAARVGAVVADLVFDSRLRPAAAGLRGDATAYQLAYECGLGRVDLQVTEERDRAGRRRVRGQIVPRARGLPAAVRLAVPDTGETAFACATDESGRFRMSPATGIYDVMLGFPEHPDAIMIPRLELD